MVGLAAELKSWYALLLASTATLNATYLLFVCVRVYESMFVCEGGGRERQGGVGGKRERVVCVNVYVCMYVCVCAHAPVCVYVCDCAWVRVCACE